MRTNRDIREIARLRLEDLRNHLSPDEEEEIERLRRQGCIVVRVPGCMVVIQKYAEEASTS